METFAPEDILIDNLSFKLNKGSSYITDRRSVSFWPSGSNIYKSDSGNRVLKFSLNGEDNSWLDPQSVRIFFTLKNLDIGAFDKKVRPLSPPYCFFRRMRIIAGNQVVEDFDNYNRVHHMFSKMMSQGARKDEANEGFGQRYDDEVKTLVNKVGTELSHEVNGFALQGFRDTMTVGFKPLCGLFSQFKYLPLKYMGNLTIELELVTNATDCIIDYRNYQLNDDVSNRFVQNVDTGVEADAQLRNTSIQWGINNARVVCDVCTLDNNLNNEYVKHLLEGKGLPITYTTYITQSQTISNTDNISIPGIRSVSKLVASFITFYKAGDPSTGFEYCDKEFCRFYHPMQTSDEAVDGLYSENKHLEFQIQLGSKLYPEYPCQLTDGKVTLLGNLEITHVDVSGSQRVLINNPDTDGFIRLSNNNLSRLGATNTGVDVYGFFTTTNNADIGGNLTCVALTETSDALLKENIKEVNTKECYKAVKYIKPKTYNFIKDEDKKSNLGFIADDLKDAKLPKEWDNILYYNDDGTKLLAYNKMTVVLWGCVQEMQKEITHLKSEITKLKNKSN